MGYSKERRAAVIAKMLPPDRVSIPSLSRQEGISEATLYKWRSEARAHPITHLRPDELAAFETLVNLHHPGLVPDQQLDPICAFRPEHEDRPAERIEPEHLRNR